MSPAATVTGAGTMIPGMGLEGIPHFSHVWIIILENKSQDEIWYPGYLTATETMSGTMPITAAAYNTPNPYLNSLVPQGGFIRNYYGDGHLSFDNYLSLTAGQTPNATTQDDCPIYGSCLAYERSAGSTVPGSGVPGGPNGGYSIADQLETNGNTWKAYMDSMPAPCTHADPNSPAADPYQGGNALGNYADRHDPFVYYPPIVDNQARCAAHVVPYTDTVSGFAMDLANHTVPDYSFITPDTCHDGHDVPSCFGGAPGKGGLIAADSWLHSNVPPILNSPEYKQGGALFIVWDESDIRSDTPAHSMADTSTCCAGGSMADGTPPGGGLIGALALSPYIRPGLVTTTSYDHNSLLRTIEDSFGIGAHIGDAGSILEHPMTDLFSTTTTMSTTTPTPVASPSTTATAATAATATMTATGTTSATATTPTGTSTGAILTTVVPTLTSVGSTATTAAGTATPSTTGTATATTAAATMTATGTGTVATTPSVSASATGTILPTATISVPLTLVPTLTIVPTTSTATPAATSTSPAATGTSTGSNTALPTPTRPATGSNTALPTLSTTASIATATGTPPPTASTTTATSTPPPTPSTQATVIASPSTPANVTPTGSNTALPTSSETATATPINTSAGASTPTITPTSAPTLTPTPTATPTPTGTTPPNATPTTAPTTVPTTSSTASPTATGTATATATGSNTAIPTAPPVTPATETATSVAAVPHPSLPRISLNQRMVSPGSPVTVSGVGFGRYERVTLSLDGVALLTSPAVVTTDGHGAFSATFIVPSSLLAGGNTVGAIGARSRASVTAPLLGVLAAGPQYYFAGAPEDAASGTHSTLALLNPNPQPAMVQLGVYYANGAVETESVTVGGTGERLVALAGLAGRAVPQPGVTGSGRTLGVTVEANRPIAAQIDVTRRGRDGSLLLGNAGLAMRWYLAEGYTGLTFRETVSILNPDVTHAARVTLHLLPGVGRAGRAVTVVVPRHTNQAVDINRAMPGRAVGLVVTSDRPIAVERTLTFARMRVQSGPGARLRAPRGGATGYGQTTRAGTTVAATSWLFAEGTTTNRFETYLTVLNPGARAARVSVSFFGRDGRLLAGRTLRVAPLSRATLSVNRVLHRVLQAGGMASVVMSDQPVVVERPEYFGSPNGVAVPGSDVFGRNGTGVKWSFPGGDMGGKDEFFLLYNPSPLPVPVNVTFYDTNDRSVTRRVVIPARARYTLNVSGLALGLSTVNGAVLQSANGQGFVAEQTVFAPDHSSLQSTEGLAR